MLESSGGGSEGDVGEQWGGQNKRRRNRSDTTMGFVYNEHVIRLKSMREVQSDMFKPNPLGAARHPNTHGCMIMKTVGVSSSVMYTLRSRSDSCSSCGSAARAASAAAACRCLASASASSAATAAASSAADLARSRCSRSWAE